MNPLKTDHKQINQPNFFRLKMSTFFPLLVVFLLFALQLVLAYPGEDSVCKTLKAEAYAPFTQIDHGGWAFVVEDIQLYSGDGVANKNVPSNLKGRRFL
jgi:hypothetical protein